jgi:hypothetical protein
MALKLRVCWEAKTLVLMSVRRSGVREYSVERARRMSFLARFWVAPAALELESGSELEAEDAEDGERRRRWGGDSSEESAGERPRCWASG